MYFTIKKWTALVHFISSYEIKENWLSHTYSIVLIASSNKLCFCSYCFIDVMFMSAEMHFFGLPAPLFLTGHLEIP